MQLLDAFTQHLKTLAQDVLVPLTPAERFILVELFTKIQANWKQVQDS
jgi:hypothetical protein